MEYRRLGRTGVMVSPLCLGTMMFGEWGNKDHDDCVAISRRAFADGVNFVDSADFYSAGESEIVLGKSLKGVRDEIVVATKGHFPMGPGPNDRGNSRRYLRRAVEASLRRLDTDRIDLYQVHRPDTDTDIEETLSALTDLQREGKILYFGTSTFPAHELVDAYWIAERRGYSHFVTEQPSYSIVARHIERELLPAARRLDLGVLCYAPLAGGWLSGRHRRSEPPPPSARAYRTPQRFDRSLPGNQLKLAAADDLAELAEANGMTLIELALGFVLAHRDVTSAIIGPRTMEHLASQIGAADRALSDDLLDAIDAIVSPGTTLDTFDMHYEPESLRDPRQRRRSS